MVGVGAAGGGRGQPGSSEVAAQKGLAAGGGTAAVRVARVGDAGDAGRQHGARS